MAEVTAAMVKQLRESTGAGMMNCKKALTEADGDMDKAVEILREKGLAAAAKKAGRIAAEGLVTTLVEGDTASIVEVNSETDFVARNATFRAYVNEVAKQALHSDAKDLETFMAEPWEPDPSLSVAQELSEMVSIISENLQIRRFAKIENHDGCIVSYIHGEGRIGVLVDAVCENVTDEVREALKNVAMQIAALKPQYVSRDEIDDEFLAHEKEILMAQIMNDPNESSKPEKVIAGMINGRLNKEMKELCLVDQVYVRADDGKQTVGQYLDQVSKSVGCPVTVRSFIRYETGEGIEKKQDNFAEEVARQMNQ